ncbi:MAG: ribonuclease Z [Luteibaculaceae bacterium]
MKFEVTILGSGGAIPKPERRSTAQVVNHCEKYFLIDCAEGTQMRFRRFGLKMQRIETVFISHLHGDHYLGIFSYLQTMSLLGRKAKLTLVADEKLWHIIQLIQSAGGGNQFAFPIEFIPLRYNGLQLVYETKALRIFSFPLNHRIPCCGFLFQEKEKPRKLIPQKLEEYKIPHYARAGLKEGLDFIALNNKIIPNELLTLPPEKSFSYAYCSDTAFFPKLKEFLASPDVLYHEATFLEKDELKAKKTYHSTTKQAWEIAQLVGAKRLYTGHFSARYENTEAFAQELMSYSPNAYTCFDGQVIKLY